jgi:flavodoxin
MKALVIYDSNFGNTKRIAEVISNGLGKDSKVMPVSDFSKKKLEGTKLLVVGSPVNAWRPTEKIKKFIAGFSKGQLEGIKAAAFDTRMKSILSGSASSKISRKLQKAGAEIIADPQAFIVVGSKGPLSEGEIEKAAKWAASIKKAL